MKTALPTFQRDGLDFFEVAKQEYKDGFVAAGFVFGHSEDSVYIQLSRPDCEPTLVLLRPDELAALLMCGSSVIWSLELGIYIESVGKPE